MPSTDHIAERLERLERWAWFCSFEDLHQRLLAIPELQAEFRKPPVPAEPTETWPGTPERALVYSRRVRRGEQVFHPRDLAGRRP